MYGSLRRQLDNNEDSMGDPLLAATATTTSQQDSLAFGGGEGGEDARSSSMNTSNNNNENNNGSPSQQQQYIRRRRRMLQQQKNKSLRRDGSVFGTLFPITSSATSASAASPRNSKSRSSPVPFSTPRATVVVATGTMDATLPQQQPQPPDPTTPPKRKKVPYSFVYRMLQPESKSWQATVYRYVMGFIIVMDVACFVASSDAHVQQQYAPFFRVEEIVVSCLFLAEYTARWMTCMEKTKYQLLGPVWGRVAYMRTWGAILDAMATLPVFLEMTTPLRNLPTLTYLRFFRLFRIWKTSGSVQALDAVYRVIYFNRQILWVAVHIAFVLVLVTAVMLYYFRPPTSSSRSDSGFHSILATAYMSTLLLLGQGGPDDDEDLPWYTRAVILITSLFSVAMFAIPASMLTWGFESEAQRLAKRARRKFLEKQKKQQQGDDETLDSTSSEDTDEEYFKLIAGEEDEEDEEGAEHDEVGHQFLMADQDHDGNITLKEFRQAASAGAAAGATAASSGTTTQLQLLQRIEQLENNVKSNSQKLDRILTLLETMTPSNRQSKK